MATVSLPDGTEIEFPDSMSGEEIRKALDRKFRPQAVAPPKPQQFDWNQPPIDYGSRKYTAADLLASNVPITQEQYLQGQKTVGSVAEMKELERRKLVPGNPNLPQDMQLQNVRDFYEKQGPGWTPYLTERVPFSPVGMIRNVQLGGLSLPGLGQVYEGAYQRYQEGRATTEDMHYIAEAEMEAKRNSEKGIIGKAADIVTQAPGLAMEVVVSGGGSAVARGAAKKMVQKYGLKAATPLAKRVAGAALKTAAATPFRTIEEASQRQQNGEAPAQSLLNAFTGQVIDRATELLGSVVPAPKRLEAISDWAKNAWIAKTGLDPTAFKERLARVGINGVLGELSEERVAEIGRGIVTGDDFGVTGQIAEGQFQEAGRQLLSEIIASAAMQGGGSVAGMAEQIGKNKGKKPVAEALPPAEDAYPDPGRPEATVDALIEEQNKGKKRDEIFRAEVDRQFNPPRIEETKRQDFRNLEPEAFFRQYEGSREALAALPDSPSRGQFAKAIGVPTSAIRSREAINTYIAAAKASTPRAPQQTVAPAQESTLPDTASPVTPPPPAQVAAPVEPITNEVPEPEKLVVPEKPEAWQRVYDQLPDDVNSLAVLASSFGIKLPKKGTKAHKALKAEDLRMQVADAMTVRPQGKFQEIKTEPKPLVTARDVQQPPVDVAEFEDAPYKSPGPYEEPGGKWVPLKKKGKASKKKGPLSDKVWKALYEDTRGKGEQFHGASEKIQQLNDGYYSSDNIYGNGFYTTDSTRTAQSYQKKNKGKNPVTYRVKEKAPVKMFNLDDPIDKNSTIVKWLSENAEGGDLLSEEAMIGYESGEAKTYAELLDYMRHGAPRDGFQEVMDALTYTLRQEGYGGFEHKGGRLTKDEPHTVKIYWEPENQVEIEEVSKQQLKKKGKKPEFQLENKPEWKGDRPLEDTREAKKQGVFISGLGRDTPATRLLVDTDFEGEVKEQKVSGAERILANLKKTGREARLVEPSSDFHRDMEKLAREFGLDVAFFESKARVAGITNANTVAFNVRSAEDNAQDYTWGIVGHEIAHGTGVDKLVDEFGEDLVEEWSKKYRDKASPDIKKRLDADKDLYQREGVASLIENFMRDPKFRTKLKQNNVTAWGRVVDKVWDVFSGFTPESKSMKTALEVLKRARNTELYHENKIREIATDTVRQHAPGVDQEQMIEDFAKLIKDKHRESVSAFKLREKAKSEAKVKLGLDARKAASIEDRGKDLSSVKSIDTVGRTLVNEYQDLSPGDAEQQDYERITWDLVSEPRFEKSPELSQSMIDEAWEQLTGGQDMRGDAWEPDQDMRGDAWEPDEEQKTLWEDSGFDLFAEEPEKVGIPTKLRNEDVQRAFGRANPATTLAGRMEIMREDLENNAPLRVPRAVAEAQAAARLSGEGAAKERDAFLKRFRDGDFGILNEVDTIVLKEILSMSSVAKALESEQASSDMDLLLMGYRVTGSEEGRSFAARRDPVHRKPEIRNNRALQDTLMPGLTHEERKAIVDALRKLGIDLMDKKLLGDDIQIARAIGEIRARRRVYDTPAMERYADMVFEYWINAILSGPHTHLKNFVGNNASLLWHSMVERTAEVAVSKATAGKLSGDKQVRDFNELKKLYGSMAGAIPIAVSNAIVRFRHEVSPLQIRTGGPQELHDRMSPRMALPGKIGKFFRAPTRLLAMSDEFTRTIGVYGAVAVNAYREAKKLGLEGNEIDRYIGASLADPSASVWQDSLREMAIVTFQQEGGYLGRKIKGVLRPVHDFPVVGRYFMTFDNFMVNAFGRFADLTPGFGLAVASINHMAGMHEADQAARDAKKKGIKSPRPTDNYGKTNWNRVVGNQIVGLVGLMVMGLYVSDDDEDKTFDISGTKERRGGKRDGQYRILPAKMFRIGDHQIPYGGYEPFDSLIAASVDFWDGMKEDSGVVASSLSAFFGQIGDKNYLQIVDDLGKLKESVDRQGAKGGMNGLKNLAAKTAVSFVPNLYRQPMRLGTNRVTSKSTWIRSDDTAADVAEKMAIEAGFISSKYAQDYDLWGRPKSQSSPSTSLAWRLAVPGGYKSQKEVLPVDIALLRYSEAYPDKEYWPAAPQVPKYNGKLVNYKDYSEFSREAGRLAYNMVKDYKFSDPPTDGEIRFIKKSLELGRKKAKANLMERLSQRNGK